MLSGILALQVVILLFINSTRGVVRQHSRLLADIPKADAWPQTTAGRVAPGVSASDPRDHRYPVHPVRGGDDADHFLGAFFTDPFRPDGTWRHVQRMHAEMDEVFERAVSDFARLHGFLDIDKDWESLITSPAIDMRERNDSYVVVVSLPGTKESDVTVTLEGRLLTVFAPVRCDAGSTIGLSMRRTGVGRGAAGAFERNIQLPGPVGDARLASAGMTNGLLKVVIPKAQNTASGGGRVSIL